MLACCWLIECWLNRARLKLSTCPNFAFNSRLIKCKHTMWRHISTLSSFAPQRRWRAAVCRPSTTLRPTPSTPRTQSQAGGFGPPRPKPRTLQLASSTRPLRASPQWLMAQLMLSVSHWRRKKMPLFSIPSCLHWKLFHNPPPTQLILLKFYLALINIIPVHTAAHSVLCYMGFPLDFKIQPHNLQNNFPWLRR